MFQSIYLKISDLLEVHKANINILIQFYVADGTMHNAPGMLLSGENISALLWFVGSAFLYDQQNSSREF